eukprot:ctg_362.g244
MEILHELFADSRSEVTSLEATLTGRAPGHRGVGEESSSNVNSALPSDSELSRAMLPLLPLDEVAVEGSGRALRDRVPATAAPPTHHLTQNMGGAAAAALRDSDSDPDAAVAFGSATVADNVDSVWSMMRAPLGRNLSDATAHRFPRPSPTLSSVNFPAVTHRPPFALGESVAAPVHPEAHVSPVDLADEDDEEAVEMDELMRIVCQGRQAASDWPIAAPRTTAIRARPGAHSNQRATSASLGGTASTSRRHARAAAKRTSAAPSAPTHTPRSTPDATSVAVTAPARPTWTLSGCAEPSADQPSSSPSPLKMKRTARVESLEQRRETHKLHTRLSRQKVSDSFDHLLSVLLGDCPTAADGVDITLCAERQGRCAAEAALVCACCGLDHCQSEACARCKASDASASGTAPNDPWNAPGTCYGWHDRWMPRDARVELLRKRLRRKADTLDYAASAITQLRRERRELELQLLLSSAAFRKQWIGEAVRRAHQWSGGVWRGALVAAGKGVARALLECIGWSYAELWVQEQEQEEEVVVVEGEKGKRAPLEFAAVVMVSPTDTRRGDERPLREKAQPVGELSPPALPASSFSEASACRDCDSTGIEGSANGCGTVSAVQREPTSRAAPVADAKAEEIATGRWQTLAHFARQCRALAARGARDIQHHACAAQTPVWQAINATATIAAARTQAERRHAVGDMLMHWGRRALARDAGVHTLLAVPILGLPVSPLEFLGMSVNPGLMMPCLAWADGASFRDICDTTPVQEGSVVRTVIRLSELLRETRNVARVIGDNTLYAKADEAVRAIKRDIIFAASLYVS